MTKRSWGVIAAMLVLALLLSDVPVLAQGAPAQAPTAVFYRPMIRVPFRNVGNQGGFFNSGMGSSAYMIYPSYGGGGGTYGADRISAAASANREAATWAVRAGHGVWTMTSDARVVYTGVRIGMQDANITPMQYDVSADPDLSLLGKEYYYHRRPTAKMGYGAGEADGVAESGLGGNWFPGSDLIEEGNKSQPYSKAPVHIYNWNFSAYPTDDTWPEEIIVTKCTNSQGLTMTERAFAWSHPDFDDLFIDEYIIENTGDKDGDGVADAAMNQSNVFIGIQDRFNNGAAGQQAYYRYWRDERDWCMDDWYVYDQNLKLMYMWDGDHPLYQDYDDTGDPYRDVYSFGTLVNGGKIDQGENALMSPAHLGVAVLAYTDDAGSAYKYNARDTGQGYVIPEGEQPYAVRFWESYNANVQDDPNNIENTEGQMYSEVLGPGRQIDSNPDHPSGQFSMLIFGPYELPVGAEAKIVLAYVAGHPGQMLGNTDWVTWARKGNQAELPKGLDALKQNLEAARFAYANAYDIPDCPPDVNFRTGSNATAQMRVDWPAEIDGASHPDYAGAEANDIAGFRVYRSEWLANGPWKLVTDIPAGTTSLETSAYRVSKEGTDYVFEDLQSAAGFFYHYSVRAYASPHTDWSAGNANSPLGFADLPSHIQTHLQVGQEGGMSAWTQRIYADESPFAMPSAETEAMSVPIKVVPNPYVLDDSHSYPGSTKIRFVGIPSHCRILVFSASGELVSDFTHDNAAQGETSYDQFTWNYNGEIATGVYFWVVESLMPASQGKRQKGTFMVIR